MSRRRSAAAIAAALFVGAAVAAPASASDSDHGYTMTRTEAQLDTKDAAQARYARWDVTADDATCIPQFLDTTRRYSTTTTPGRDWRRFQWHRWVCSWDGFDGEDRYVSGYFRITSHTDGTYGYMPLYGGIVWEDDNE